MVELGWVPKLSLFSQVLKRKNLSFEIYRRFILKSFGCVQSQKILLQLVSIPISRFNTTYTFIFVPLEGGFFSFHFLNCNFIWQQYHQDFEQPFCMRLVPFINFVLKQLQLSSASLGPGFLKTYNNYFKCFPLINVLLHFDSCP